MARHGEQDPHLLTRREMIGRVTALLGGIALVGGDALLASRAFARPRVGGGVDPLFSAEDVAYLDEIADTILPDTDTPGAKAAATGAFMALMVADVYSPDDQQVFLDGMARLNQECVDRFGHGFMLASPTERIALLEQLDQEQHAYMTALEAARGDEPGPLPHEPAGPRAHYFRMMKELALLGYFTSEIGYHQAMRYIETPGRFDPCVPHRPGERIWATHA